MWVTGTPKSRFSTALEVLVAVAPDIATAEIAAGIHRRLRSLSGHWASTAYGEAMVLEWPE